MAARYWVTLGTGTWNDSSNWSATSGGASGASVPTAADTVFFDAASGTGDVTLDVQGSCVSITCTGFAGRIAFGTNNILLNGVGTVFTGSTTMGVTGTPLIILTNGTATARTITPTAVTEANSISFRITAGTGTLSVTTTGGPAVRDLDFTDGVNPTGYGGALQNLSLTIYGNFKASTNMTKVAGTSGLTFAATSGTKTINTAGVAFDNPFAFNGVGGTWQLQDALTSGATRTTTLTAGTLDLNGYTLTTGLFSSNNSNVRTLAFGSGKIVLTNNGGTILSMSTATNFSYTGTSRIECNYSGSTGTRTITPPATNAVESNSLNIYVTTGSDTVTVSGAARFLNFDLTGFTGTLTYSSNSRYFGDLVFSSGMTLDTVSGGFTFAKTSGIQKITSNGKTINNSVIFDSSGSGATFQLQDAFTTAGATTLTAGTLNLNNKTLTTNTFVSNNANVRTLSFGTLGGGGALYLTSASTTANVTVFNANDSTNFTADRNGDIFVTGAPTAGFTRSFATGSLSSGGGSLSNALNFNITAGSDTISFGTTDRVFNNIQFSGSFSGNIGADVAPYIYGFFSNNGFATITGGTNAWVFKSTSSTNYISSSNAINNPVIFDGVGGAWQIYNNLVVNGAVTLTNGTLQIQDGTTLIVGSFSTSGTNRKYLQSITPGTQSYISDASGVNSVSYLTIRDIAATGGATWNAFYDQGNINAGNNSGWYFGDSPTVGNEITMRLRSFTQPRRF
jgi:hypothetical protein